MAERLTAGAVGQVQVDAFVDGLAFGSVAQRLLAANMDVNALRTNANETLLHEEWLLLDRAVVEAARSRLAIVGDLIAAGCVLDMNGQGLAQTVLAYQQETKAGNAQLSMDGLARGILDRPEYGISYLPLPLVHCDYTINARVLAESRRFARPLDTTMAAQAAARVAEKIDEIALIGASSFAFGGGTLYGIKDFTNRNTVSLAHQWNASGVTGQQILDQIQAGKQASINDGHYGPWGVYIPTAYESVIGNDFKANGDLTILDRILKLQGVQFVHIADQLTVHNVLMVELKPMSMRIVVGLQPTNVEWDSHGGLQTNYKVMAIMVPQPMSDIDGKSGIVHIS